MVPLVPNANDQQREREIIAAMATISSVEKEKPHVVLIPYPAQGHLTPILSLARLLHHRGFHVTFVNSEYNHRRLRLASSHSTVLDRPGFRFETVPDGLPPSDRDGTQDIWELCASFKEHAAAPFRDLLLRLKKASPPVTCVVADGAVSYMADVAEGVGVPALLFFTPSAAGLLAYMNFAQLITSGYTPLKDENQLTNGYLDTSIEWIPAMEGIRLRDLPSFIRTTNPSDTMLHVNIDSATGATRARGVILNTFDALDLGVLAAIRSAGVPNLYAVGPISAPSRQLIRPSCPSTSIHSSLWREDAGCAAWLDGREDGSVVYVNFGSITVLTREEMAEFAWGLAGSGCPFLWVVRPDLVAGGEGAVPAEFVEKTKGRGKLAGWCNQGEVLGHPAVGGFLTHCGWNSMLEGMQEGVPMACWPFFAEQQTNCWFACQRWGVGVEIEGKVTREKVAEVVRKLMEKGGEGRGERAREWKEKAAAAVEPGGSSSRDLERLIGDLRAFRSCVESRSEPFVLEGVPVSAIDPLSLKVLVG